jgi:DNA-binding response OmpR family regulator
MAALPNLSVLVVEDNPDAAETLAILLDMQGYAVSIAHSGEAALQLAVESSPDAVILDLGLPGMDGIELARHLRATLVRQPLLIALSGYTDREQECYAAGFDLYVIKTANPDALNAILQAPAIRTEASMRHDGPLNEVLALGREGMQGSVRSGDPNDRQGF